MHRSRQFSISLLTIHVVCSLHSYAQSSDTSSDPGGTDASPTVRRFITRPVHFRNDTFEIVLDVSQPNATADLVVEETIPAGWSVLYVSRDGLYENGTVSWLLPDFQGDITLSYTVLNPLTDNPDLGTEYLFTGTVNHSQPIIGDTITQYGLERHYHGAPPPYVKITGDLTVGQWPYATCKTIMARGGYAFAGVGGSVVILDISDDQNPREVGSVETPHSVHDLFLRDNYLFIANLYAGLSIVDVSDPRDPVLVGRYNDIIEMSQSVHVYENYAYINDNNNYLKVLDIQDVTRPREVFSLPIDRSSFDIVMHNGYAYLGGGDILDMRDPSHPEPIGNFCTGLANHPFQLPLATGLYIKDDLLYVAVGFEGLYVIDISNPTAPMLFRHMYEYKWTWDVSGEGDYVCVTDAEGFLRILDVADPDNITELNAVNLMAEGGLWLGGGDWERLYVADQKVFSTHPYRGLRIHDISEPENAQLRSFYYFPGICTDVKVKDHIAYVANSNFNIIDVADPQNPKKLSGTNNPSDEFTTVEIGDGSAFVAGLVLKIFDISNPGALREIDTVMHGSGAVLGAGLELRNNTLYWTSSTPEHGDSLHVIDVTNPEQPSLRHSINKSNYNFTKDGSEYYPEVFEIDGDFLFLATHHAHQDFFHTGYISVCDISNPEEPTELSRIELSTISRNDYVQSMCLKEHVLYVCTWQDGFYVIDVSVPNDPKILGYSPYFCDAFDLLVEDDFAYLVANGVRVIDVRVPEEIMPVVNLVGIHYGGGIDSDEHFLYVAEHSYGMRVLRKPSFSRESVFQDEHLENKVKAVVQVEHLPIYRYMTYLLKPISELDLRDSGIRDIRGLEYCEQLERLLLSGNHVSDLSPLANLDNLDELHLGRNGISDISGLANLVKLRGLWLDGNRIEEISAISYLGNLGNHDWKGSEFDLDLSDNDIRDISPLVDNPGIDEGDVINLKRNPLSYESFYVHIPELEQRGVIVRYDEAPPPTPTQTFTPAPTSTRTFPPTPTATSTPTYTATVPPTATATFTPTFTATPTPIPFLTRWDFDRDGDFEGWDTVNIVDGDVADGSLQGKTETNDPIVRLIGVNIDSRYVSGIAFRLRTNNQGRGQVYVGTRNGDWTLKHVIDFPYEGGETFKTHVVPLTGDVFVHPIIALLRIDPATVAETSFEIDWIGLVSSGVPTPTPTPAPPVCIEDWCLYGP